VGHEELKARLFISHVQRIGERAGGHDLIDPGANLTVPFRLTRTRRVEGGFIEKAQELRKKKHEEEKAILELTTDGLNR